MGNGHRITLLVGGRNLLWNLASSSFKSDRETLANLHFGTILGLSPLLAEFWRLRMREFECFFSSKISPKTLPLNPILSSKRARREKDKWEEKSEKKGLVSPLPLPGRNQQGGRVRKRGREGQGGMWENMIACTSFWPLSMCYLHFKPL